MSKKKIIAIIFTLVVLITSVSAISYSIATRGSSDSQKEIETEPVNRGANPASDYKTNIDLIIENSNKSGDEAQTFNVVEIVPVGAVLESGPNGESQSDLSRYIENGYFKSNVFDANSTKNATMKPGMILMDTIKISAATTLEDKIDSNITNENSKIGDVLNKADLIYISSPSYSAYDNNMNEDIYNYLHTYAQGKDKPVIMDFVKPGDTGAAGASKTYKDLIGEIRNNHIRFRTFSWRDDASAKDFFEANLQKKSYYITYNTNQMSSNGKVLVVTTNQNEQNSMYQKMSSEDKDTIIDKAYYGRNKPKDFEYTFVNPTALTVEQLNESYDFILLENNIMNTTMTNDVFSKLKALSEACRYILYDFRGSFESGSSSYVGTNNYLKLMNLVLTANGIAKQSNILSVRYGFFASLNNAGADGVASAKGIADIINTAEYRDSSTSGENGSAYRVLEIQPCYPIDTELAESQPGNGSKYPYKGMYYTIPDQVLFNVTKDEIEEDQEYYAFEMSRAKISHATGIPYNQIQVDQMSVDELISTKNVILENYDLVYIGGDTSALVSHEYVNYAGSNWNFQHNYVASALKYLTQFDMYTHTGNFVDYNMSYGEVAGGTNSVEFSGHDLTTIKRDELKDFVNSGLPIIIDKTVTDEFESSYAYDPANERSKNKNRLEQLSLKMIDPDCNMYQFLTYTYELIQSGSSKGNVAWGTINTDDKHATRLVKNTDNEFGHTRGGQVTVYNESYETIIKNLVENAALRPSLKITAKPKEYVEGDDSTVNTENAASFTAGVTTSAADTSSYKVELFVDSNGDCTYAETEMVDDAVCSAGGTVNLSYALDDDFFGLVNWKIKVTAANGVLCDSRTGTALFKLDSEMKKTVRVLQVMPLEKSEQTGFSSGFSLFFCTECQQAMRVLENNVLIVGNDKNGNPGLNSNVDQETVLGGVKVGKHEHKFGIVKYDSTVATDDWEDNFADTLTHGADGTLETGDYEFDLDIVTPSEFDAMCADAAGRTDLDIGVETQLAEQYLEEYEQGLESQTLAVNRAKLESELYEVADQIRNTGSGRRRNEILKGIGTASKPGNWMIDQAYYKFWEYCNDRGNNDLASALNLSALKAAWHDYITEYDELVAKKKLYKEHSRKASDHNTWLLNNYDMIVLGLADDFNNKDLSTVSCGQLKTYVTQGGSILNTHDTMTKYKDKGAVNLTNALRTAFGMDRFHVQDVGSSNKVELAVPKTGSKKVMIGTGNSLNQWYQGGKEITVGNKDLTINIVGDNIWSMDVVEGTEHTSVTDKIKITIHSTQAGVDFRYWDKTKAFSENRPAADGNGNYTFEVEQAVDYTSKASFVIGKNNITAAYDISAGTLTAKANDTEVGADGRIKIEVTVTDGDAAVPDGTAVQCSFRGNAQIAAAANGAVTFMVNPAQAAASSIYDSPSGFPYRQYETEDSSKFFWTERIIAASPSEYAAVASKLEGISIKRNAPVGITDLFASYDSSSRPTSPYRYVMMSDESFNHMGTDLDGSSFEAKYGTRKAAKVNQGGVTMYPFAISSELLISPTHAQMFALDLEDPTVAVWYTLGANFVSSNPPVDAYFARYDSGMFAASPKDGMNAYFLYSKNNVFYCGAGHQKVTGNMKDNNDERRLFINVIVNSVSKGKAKPKLKLYNKCDEKGAKHENCDDKFVNPRDEDDNKKLSKEKKTLFYNDAIKMYQYNIDDDQEELYPEFDFKAIAGTADIKEITVFYDLNYGEGDGMDSSDVYKADKNHVLITSYDAGDNMDSKRVRLRESAFPKLLLKEDYFENYNNYTYIVIRVKDEANQWQSARVKINKIPQLFDLTDAGFDFNHCGLSDGRWAIDMTDRKQFNI